MARAQGLAALLISCSFIALASPAMAQATRPPPSAATGDQAEARSVTELVVTAEKREEPVQKVPIAVTVVGQAQLQRQNITQISDLEHAVPDLSTRAGTNAGNPPGQGIAIRGISTQGFARSAESAVSVVVDGVVLGRASINSLFDVSRVEVLPGPQGMLFGKNASAGVINIVTNAPDPSHFEAIAHADLGFERDYDIGQLTLNIPISNDAALRVSGHYNTFGNIYQNNFLHKSSYDLDGGIRARFLWRPNDRLTVNIIGDYDYSWDNGIGSIVGPERFVVPGSPLAAVMAACGVVPSPTNTHTCTDGPAPGAFSPSQTYGGSIQIDYLLPGDFLLTSITADRRYQIQSLSFTGPGDDSDNVPTNVLNTNTRPEVEETISQELRLTSPTGHFAEYVAGLYFSDEISHSVVNQSGGLGLLPPPLQVNRYWRFHVDQKSYAAFGQATFHVTDAFRVLAGLRLTHETLLDDAIYSALPGFIVIPSFSPITTAHATATTNNFSWRLGAEYDVARDVMAYFTATQGYKGPMANDQAPGAARLIISPEIPLDFELGVKSSFLDHRLAIDAAFFDDHVKNFQTTVFVPPTAGNPLPSFAQGNAPYVESRGLDITFFGEPLPGLSLNGGLLYNNAHYSGDFLVACKQGSAPGCVTHAVSNISPKWKATLSAEYARPVADRLDGFVQADVDYRSRIFFGSTPDPMTVGPGRAIFGARVGVRRHDGRWGVSLFARNLFDKRDPVAIGGDPLSGFNGGLNGSYVTDFDINSFRVVGLTLDARL